MELHFHLRKINDIMLNENTFALRPRILFKKLLLQGVIDHGFDLSVIVKSTMRSSEDYPSFISK